MTDKIRLIGIVQAVTAFLALSAGLAQGETITVGPGGGYDFRHIQKAIDAAGPGDTVIVYPHTYYENINFPDKAITVRSSNPNDLDIVKSTIVDGGGLNSVVIFAKGAGADSVLEGLTITNGSGHHGGGIYGADSSATVRKCFIVNNAAESHGGAIYGCDGKILNCTIVGNSADWWGGGLAHCDGTIRNCTIVDNSAGGLACGVWECGGSISNCIFWGNQPGDNIDYWFPIPTHSCIQDFLGASNMSDDPLFVNPGAVDYRLRADSPCINAGDPNFVPEPGETDIDGDPRVLLGRVDIGADEFSGNLRAVADAGPDQSFTDIPALVTLDGSGSADDDGDTLAYHWRQTAGPEVELDDSNAVGPSFVPQEYGAYVFELVVSDGSLDSFADTVNIVVGSGYVPVADAGLSRYAAAQLAVDTVNGRIPVDCVVLDGTGSYDADGPSPLSYHWRQISGPTLNITGANTATPTITGFAETNSVQVCQFELVVGDGDYNSPPDIAEVMIVRPPAGNNMVLENDSGVFDPDKPTTVYFAGSREPWSDGPWDDTEWQSLANVISFSEYEPENGIYTYTFGRVSDMIIAYLSSVVPDYRLPIEVMGGSGGTRAATPVAVYLDKYRDARYNANRVSLFDSGPGCAESIIRQFIAVRVDGEQSWLGTFNSIPDYSGPGMLNVRFELYDHSLPQAWYRATTDPALTPFNGGVVAGAYWSVLGPGKNLQLAYTPDTRTYEFRWYGDHTSGYMVLDPNCTICGKLPEPVTLINPVAGGTTDPNPAPGLLTCEESENAVGYQLLFGSDPYRVAHYIVVSDTLTPPNQVITTFPFEKTYWTIKARDQYGSTIYADPVYISSFILTRPIENLSTGKRYGYIQHAVNEAAPGDEIVAKPGTYYESLDFKGRDLTLRSTDPNDPAVVAATIISGDRKKPVVTFSGSDAGTCVLAGF
ncbi:MAG: PKD domain-containing protein, partial [Planctomycetota bacterium]